MAIDISNAQYFIWQGRKSLDYGIVLTAIPQISFASKRYETTTTSYHNGAMINPLALETKTITLDIAFVNTVGISSYQEFVEEMTELFYEVREMSSDIESHQNKLILSRDASTDENVNFFWYEAYLTGEIDFNQLYRYRTASVSFTCQPLKTKGSNSLSMTYISYEHKWTTSSKISTNTNTAVTLYTDNQFLMQRTPHFKMSFTDNNWSRWLTTTNAYLCFTYTGSNGTSSTYQGEGPDKIVYRRSFFIDNLKLRTLIYTYASVTSFDIFIDSLNNKYILKVVGRVSGEESDSTYYTDIGNLIESNLNKIGLSESDQSMYKDRLLVRNKLSGRYDDKTDSINYARQVLVGNATSSYPDSIRINVITTSGGIVSTLTSFCNVTYYQRETQI